LRITSEHLKLSIVIVTYNRHKDLVECLDSIYEMNNPPFETIVVDSCSDDDTQKVKDLYPVRFKTIDERSMVRARNIGITLAKGDIVAFLDDDVLVHSDWSRYLLETYTTNQIGAVGGRVIPDGSSTSHFQKVRVTDVGKVSQTGLVIGNYDTPLESSVEVDSLIGCNMSFKKDVIEKVGSFDENYTGNCFRDDTDYCLRVKHEGYKLLYQPKALVWHKFKGKVVGSEWVYWYARNHTYFYFKNLFAKSRLKIGFFFYQMFLPPRDYAIKSGVKVKLSPKLVPLMFQGVLDGFSVYRKK